MTLPPPEFVILKEKIAVCDAFTTDERDLILDCLNLGDYAGKHDYPAHHGPHSGPWARAAWAILDQLNPDALKRRDRFLLGGLIGGALSEMYENGRRGRVPR
jgi:hypothetical protein